MESDYRYKLLCRLANASSLQEMADLSYELLKNPVFIADMAHTMLAFTKEVDIPHSAWQDTVVQGKLSRNLLRQDRDVNGVYQASVRNRMPLLVTDGDIPFPRIIKALIQDGKGVGVLVLTAYLRPFGPDDIELIELISTFVLTQMSKEHYITSSSSNTVENYLIKLLESPSISRERILKRFDILLYTPRKYIYILAAQIRKQKGMGRTTTIEPLREDFSNVPHCKAFFFDAQLILVCDFDTEVTDWEAEAPQLMEKMSSWDMRAGVSRCFTEWEKFSEHQQQAVEALDLGFALKRDEQRLFFYDLFSAYKMFERLPQDTLYLYCHKKILNLDEYDRQQNSCLCITLQVYLEQAKSLAKTADLLFIHRNTVRYRINKCMELMDTKLEDGNEIFSFILSLRILEYHRKQLNRRESGR